MISCVICQPIQKSPLIYLNSFKRFAFLNANRLKLLKLLKLNAFAFQYITTKNPQKITGADLRRLSIILCVLSTHENNSQLAETFDIKMQYAGDFIMDKFDFLISNPNNEKS